MSEVMLISDDLRRTERLLRDLRLLCPSTIYDLYDHTPPVDPPAIVLSDVRDLTSDAIARLKHLLILADIGRRPHILVVHEEGPRTQAHAQMLGVTTMVAAAALSTLPHVIERVVVEAGMAPLSAQKQASQARQFLRDTMMAGMLTRVMLTRGLGVATCRRRHRGASIVIRSHGSCCRSASKGAGRGGKMGGRHGRR